MRRVIVTVKIYVMNNKTTNIIVFTTIANYFSMFSKAFCKTLRNVRFTGGKSTMKKIGAFLATEALFFSLKSNSSSNYISTKLARRTLYAG